MGHVAGASPFGVQPPTESRTTIHPAGAGLCIQSSSDEKGQDFGGRDQLLETNALVRGVGDTDVAWAVEDRGHRRVAGEEPQIASIGNAVRRAVASEHLPMTASKCSWAGWVPEASMGSK